MENADMKNADMENTDMENADIENTDVENVDMENADKHVKNSCMVDGLPCNRFGLMLYYLHIPNNNYSDSKSRPICLVCLANSYVSKHMP